MRRNAKEQKLRKIWAAMIRRCEDQDDPSFHNYGGRGITVCEAWRNLDNFIADMGFPPYGMTLERRDNNGSYTPQNCVWASRKAQNRNQRTNRLITYQGLTQCLAAWAEEFGVASDFLRRRMDVQGMSFEKAVIMPKRYSVWRKSLMEEARGLR